ncbi:hypothetical protein D8674_036786 [Pyrus ussuriensis x Pyrus communis]|uniref:Uncharacterized protein n=1 Tax=Pyrus ussuriensis x Pyrus communis TaxID=2448454 RepID=A0A5N5EUQ3_9ROSA|nr:hypothetical protein D8674_036786 [Pyrus ussuriensis x Pyrus communis]
MTSDQGEAVLKLNGRASGSTHESIVNPVVIQNDASNVKSFRLCQEGRPIGVYYADLKAVWQELDQRRPIKMECALDLKILYEEVQLDRVYAFLAGLDDVFDKVCRRIPLVAMVTRPLSSGRLYGQSSSTDSRLFTRENKDDFKCTFCGQTRHMKDTCFQKHGVPEWFLELKKKLCAKEQASNGASGRRPPMVATTTGNKDAVPTQGDPSQALLTRFNPNEFSSNTGTDRCILDSGATDHMIFDKRLFKHMITTHQKCVATANGNTAVVTGAGTMDLTPSLSFHHYLLVSSFSHNLLSIPQVTEQLDCVVLMYPFFCLLQDIQTKEIIGHGTKREGLCYVDDVIPSRANTNMLTLRFLIFFRDQGIFHETTCSYTPQQNGGVSSSCDLDGVFEWLDVQEARSSRGVHGVPSDAGYDTRSPYAEPVASRQQVLTEPAPNIPQLIAKEETANPCVGATERECTDDQPTMAEASPLFSSTADRSLDRYKARLVAKGYAQTYGVNYQETFSLVAKMNTVRVLISLAANLNWPLKQFDVKNAFLHVHLEEEVYMDFLPGYGNGGKMGVCRLRKSLYGLKQSPRAWFGRFTQAMRKNGYYQSHSDHTFSVKRRNDDMIITGDDLDEIIKLEKNLSAEFEMKGLGDLKYFLGVEETCMLGKPVDTPIMEKHYLGVYPDQEPVDKGRYQKLVRRLVYLAHTHPDIAYAVSVVSQFMHSPSVDHMPAVMRILAYLKSAPGKGILYKNSSHLRMKGFTDADWASDVIDSCFTSGYFTFVGGNLVTWRSKKQNVVSRSLAEAEFRGMAHGICEVLWLHKLLGGLGFKANEAISLYCDNKSAREIVENLVQHDRTKHVEVDRHFIKEKLEKKIVSILFVNSEEQLADILTHAVCSRVFGDSLVKLGMCDIYSLT